MNRYNPEFKRQRAPVGKRKRPTVELWTGWRFENELIYSPDGNHYTKRDIELSFHASKIIDEKFGTSSNIFVLKEMLNLRNRLAKVPTVSLIFENEDGPDDEFFYDLIPSHIDR
jgi:hypothetical protein